MNSETNTSSNRSFGIVFSIVFLIIAIYPLINDEDIRIWSLVISVIFLILGYFKSTILTPLNSLWYKFGIFLGKIVSPIILGVIYFFIVTPTSILMRLFKKDLLNLKFSNNKSYWIKKQGPKSEMKNQY
tara:strand:+ start:47962 stop:48348 length:387 start_codon:yes stop_codon:yes gene_type:complete